MTENVQIRLHFTIYIGFCRKFLRKDRTALLTIQKHISNESQINRVYDIDNIKQEIEETVVGGYKKIEDAFVGRYLTHDGESVEDAKKRLQEKTR